MPVVPTASADVLPNQARSSAAATASVAAICPLPCPDLDRMAIHDPEIRLHLQADRPAAATEAAARRVAQALTDLGTTRLAARRLPDALRAFEEAVNHDPGDQAAFHNLVAAAHLNGELRGPVMQAVLRRLVEAMPRYGWAAKYRRLLYLPIFLNLEFVLGKCNLRCRMCLGTNSPSYPDRLTCMSAEDFDRMLTAAPTVSGLTLSSGDADPLLHPDLSSLIDLAAKHRVVLDIYTNGLPLAANKCRRMVQSGIVRMLNFSVNAATPETYERLHHAELARVIRKMEMLQAMRMECGSPTPWTSLSFVAMADNIQELPAFVDLARRVGGRRVLVNDLIGWEDGQGPNQVATQHPGCFEFVAEARRRAADAGLRLVLPERLAVAAAAGGAEGCVGAGASGVDGSGTTAAEAESAVPQTEKLARCGWMNGVWVCHDGRLDPCCLVHGVADLGNIKDGPLLANDRYARVKELLFAGKVFPECQGQRMCRYVQEQLTAGRTPDLITPADLGS